MNALEEGSLFVMRREPVHTARKMTLHHTRLDKPEALEPAASTVAYEKKTRPPRVAVGRVVLLHGATYCCYVLLHAPATATPAVAIASTPAADLHLLTATADFLVLHFGLPLLCYELHAACCKCLRNVGVDALPRRIAFPAKPALSRLRDGTGSASSVTSCRARRSCRNRHRGCASRRCSRNRCAAARWRPIPDREPAALPRVAALRWLSA
jgi:hypothetical protein